MYIGVYVCCIIIYEADNIVHMRMRKLPIVRIINGEMLALIELKYLIYHTDIRLKMGREFHSIWHIQICMKICFRFRSCMKAKGLLKIIQFNDKITMHINRQMLDMIKFD